jgi:hypothetical protein
MKKTFFAVLTGALVIAGIQSARAGDREWAVAGKVLTGVVVASAISHAVQPAPVYSAYSYSYAPAYAPCPPAYRYCPPPPVVYCPPPVVVYRAPVYVAPPVVNFRFALGGGHRHHRHGCW